MQKTANEHERPGIRCFGSAISGKSTMLGNYSSAVMYVNHYDDKDLNWRYENGVMSMSVEELRAFASYNRYDV